MDVLLYFREFFFFFFQTFTIFFLFKNALGFSNITECPTGIGFQNRPIVGRGTLYYPVVLCFSGFWYACYSKAAGLHGDQPHLTQMGPAYPVYDLPFFASLFTIRPPYSWAWPTVQDSRFLLAVTPLSILHLFLKKSRKYSNTN